MFTSHLVSRPDVIQREFAGSPALGQCSGMIDASPERLEPHEAIGVVNVLRCLPRRQHDILCLSRLNGLSHAEIARRLGTEEADIRRELVSALAALRILT